MNIYIYIVPIDDGAAPNPYGEICTLNLCKPRIRKNAKVGDWIIGLGKDDYFGQELKNHIIYAMKITNILTMKEYDKFCLENLPIKIPNITSNNIFEHMGDCVYKFNKDKIDLRAGVHSRCTKDEDLEGKNTLLSTHYYYFGKSALKLKQKFENLVDEKVDFKILDNDTSNNLLTWLKSQDLILNKIYDEPNRLGIIKPTDRINEKSCCIRKKDIRSFSI